jgi:hypothetical protein
MSILVHPVRKQLNILLKTRRLVAIPLLIHRATSITKLFEQARLALFRLPLPGILTTINIRYSRVIEVK